MKLKFNSRAFLPDREVAPSASLPATAVSRPASETARQCAPRSGGDDCARAATLDAASRLDSDADAAARDSSLPPHKRFKVRHTFRQ